MMALTMFAALAAQNGDEKLGFFDLVIFFVFFFIVEAVYHKIFDVIYVGSKGCFTEIMVSTIIAIVMLLIFKKIWWIILIIAIIVLIIKSAIDQKNGG